MQAAGSWRRGVRGWRAETGDAIVSVFFPAGCRICDQLLTGASRVPICLECLESFELVPERRCEICGQPLPKLTPTEDERVVCPACQENTYALERARTYGIYDGVLVRAILLLKWERIEPLAAWFAQRLSEVVHQESPVMAADVVVPVPLHQDGERERGYNQAGLVAKPLARKLGLPD